VYATCLFCNQPLGRNESLEAFPVGKRLAFDAARGRLWVVCPKCERWNLSPFDERWEAIEQAERIYRDARRRVTTDNIGLARTPDGTTLIRIGEPLRPEFAAWRYGDQFGRRRRRMILMTAGGVSVLGTLVVGGVAAGVGVGGFAWVLGRLGTTIVHGRPESVVARIRTESHGLVHVRRRHLAETSIAPGDDGSLAINLRFKNGQARFTGREAERIASIIVPKVNRFGAGKSAVASAVKEIESHGSSERFIDHLADVSRVYTRPLSTLGKSRWKTQRTNSQFNKYGLFSLPVSYRLALEMALHEEAERRAMEGELAELEGSWREAEEIAAISDNLLVPQPVEAALKKLKGTGD
jgi:hypothetical protein